MRGNELGRDETRDADPGSVGKDRVEPPRRVYREPEEAGPPLGQRELFLGEVESSGQVPAGVSVKDATQTVLCTVIQRLEGHVAADLERALPEDIGALFRVCSRWLDDQPGAFDQTELLQAIAAQLDVSVGHAEGLTRSVLSSLRLFLQSGEEGHLANNLPPDIWELWRTP